MADNIKNIIFDFGGVLIDLNYNKCFDTLMHLLNFSEPIPASLQLILDEYEMGYFSEASFLHRLQRLADQDVTERQLLNAWNAMLLTLPKYRLDFVRELRANFDVYLLSNTNHTHLTYLRQHIFPKMGVNHFESDHFDKAYYSHEIKFRKPNHDIYNYVLEDSELNPSETLFIDDNADNIKGAKELGIVAVQHDPQKEITEKFQDYLKVAK